MNYVYTQNDTLLHYYTCGNLMSRDSFLHVRRTMDCHVLILVLKGCLPITVSGVPHLVKAGEFIFLKAGEEHYGHTPAKGSLSYFWVHFSSDHPWHTYAAKASLNLCGLPKDFTYFLPEHGSPIHFQRVSLLFRQLIDFSRQDPLYLDAMLPCSLSLLLMEITQECLNMLSGTLTEFSPTIYSIMEWVKSNCHTTLTASEIAEHFHYNQEYLSALFKKETGMTLTYYLNKCRIEVSKVLLQGSDISIKEAAYSCGFHDEKYYMKMFRKYEGITPLQYKTAFHKKRINH